MQSNLELMLSNKNKVKNYNISHWKVLRSINTQVKFFTMDLFMFNIINRVSTNTTKYYLASDRILCIQPKSPNKVHVDKLSNE